MSLHTDSVFISALRADADLMEAIGGRLYGTAIPLPDEALDNVPVPYAVVTFDGLTNDGETKDDFEGETDTVRISVEVTGKTLESLHALTHQVRSAIYRYMREGEGEHCVLDYSLSAGGIQYDQWKPCWWQTLTYNCNTLSDLIEQDNGSN